MYGLAQWYYFRITNVVLTTHRPRSREYFSRDDQPDRELQARISEFAEAGSKRDCRTFSACGCFVDFQVDLQQFFKRPSPSLGGFLESFIAICEGTGKCFINTQFQNPIQPLVLSLRIPAGIDPLKTKERIPLNQKKPSGNLIPQLLDHHY